jgi:hypothetical protein
MLKIQISNRKENRKQKTEKRRENQETMKPIETHMEKPTKPLPQEKPRLIGSPPCAPLRALHAHA